MPGEKRHVAGLLGDQEALGANWKSAQCVTSLYDSYIQLQRENEELRENGRRLPAGDRAAGGAEQAEQAAGPGGHEMRGVGAGDSAFTQREDADGGGAST
ncbi:hypothetical protein PRIC1_013931 [Phytophthora ramorum]